MPANDCLQATRIRRKLDRTPDRVRASADVGAVLVQIDLDGDRPHASSLVALAAGRAIASSWGATLYAALVMHDPTGRSAPDAPAQVVSASRLAGIDEIQTALARGGADKVMVAVIDEPVGPAWAVVGTAWQRVLERLRPRLVLLGADAASASELAARTAEHLGARLLTHARAVELDELELRDRDGSRARVSDAGTAVALIGGDHPALDCDDDVDLELLVVTSADAVRRQET